jgi:hypothetical protein
MGLFYLNIKDGSGNIPEEEGIDLPDVEAAKREALPCARSPDQRRRMSG